MQQEDAQAADQLALLRPPHAVDFLGDMLDVGLSQFPRSQELGLLAAPGEEIALVEDTLQGHDGKIGGSRTQVTRRSTTPLSANQPFPSDAADPLPKKFNLLLLIWEFCSIFVLQGRGQKKCRMETGTGGLRHMTRRPARRRGG